MPLSCPKMHQNIFFCPFFQQTVYCPIQKLIIFGKKRRTETFGTNNHLQELLGFNMNGNKLISDQYQAFYRHFSAVVVKFHILQPLKFEKLTSPNLGY